MKVKPAPRVSELKPSATLAISAKSKEMKSQGIDVVGFGAGEPDFVTPERIREAAKASLDRGETSYTPAGGLPALKKAFTDRLAQDYGLEYQPDQVLVSCGAKHSLFNLFLALIGDGDEVVIPAPYWLSYPAMVELAGGTPVIIGTPEKAGFVPSIEAVKAAITPRTKAVIVNSPSNPTGVLYPDEFLNELATLLQGTDIVVISDDIYDKLIYDGKKFTPLASLDGMKERTIIVNGVSKTYAMTGLRIGYLACPIPEVLKAASNIQSQSTSNPSNPAQYAAVEALTGPQDEVDKMRSVFEKRRDLMMDLLSKIDGLTVVKPDGAFYAFVNVSSFYGNKGVNNSTEFATYLLDNQYVACVPGSPFGSDDHVRLSFATDDETIAKGVERLGTACSELRS